MVNTKRMRLNGEAALRHYAVYGDEHCFGYSSGDAQNDINAADEIDELRGRNEKYAASVKGLLNSRGRIDDECVKLRQQLAEARAVARELCGFVSIAELDDQDDYDTARSLVLQRIELLRWRRRRRAATSQGVATRRRGLRRCGHCNMVVIDTTATDTNRGRASLAKALGAYALNGGRVEELAAPEKVPRDTVGCPPDCKAKIARRRKCEVVSDQHPTACRCLDCNKWGATTAMATVESARKMQAEIESLRATNAELVKQRDEARRVQFAEDVLTADGLLELVAERDQARRVAREMLADYHDRSRRHRTDRGDCRVMARRRREEW